MTAHVLKRSPEEVVHGPQRLLTHVFVCACVRACVRVCGQTLWVVGKGGDARAQA